MLNLVGELIQRLDAAGVRYCHWKSNLRLVKSLAGDTDLDLMVDPATREGFERVVTDLRFIVASPDIGRDAPGARHYFGLDEATGKLVHLDVLGAVVTGGTLAKSYQLPVGGLIWEQIERIDGVPVTSRPAELALLLVRKYLEASSVAEYPLLRREWPAITEEFDWLTADLEDGARALSLLTRWLPAIPDDVRVEMLPTFRDGTWVERRALGQRVARALRPYRRQHPIRTNWSRVFRLRTLVLRKLTVHRAGLSLGQPAPLIAFVGPKAVGKSTLIEDTRAWLVPHFDVRTVHAGRPPSTWISLVPNALLPVARRLLPGYRHSTVTAEARREMPARRSAGSALYVGRSVLLAHDKQRLIARASRWSRGGVTVISDRYPLPGPDGPLLDPADLEARGLVPEARAAQIEHKYFDRLPAPDVIVVLRADVDATVRRNEARSVGHSDPDDESLVRMNHGEQTNVRAAEASGSLIVKVDTGGDLASTILDLRAQLWRALLQSGTSALSPSSDGETSAPNLAYHQGGRARGV